MRSSYRVLIDVLVVLQRVLMATDEVIEVLVVTEEVLVVTAEATEET